MTGFDRGRPDSCGVIFIPSKTTPKYFPRYYKNIFCSNGNRSWFARFTKHHNTIRCKKKSNPYSPCYCGARSATYRTGNWYKKKKKKSSILYRDLFRFLIFLYRSARGRYRIRFYSFERLRFFIVAVPHESRLKILTRIYYNPRARVSI